MTLTLTLTLGQVDPRITDYEPEQVPPLPMPVGADAFT